MEMVEGEGSGDEAALVHIFPASVSASLTL